MLTCRYMNRSSTLLCRITSGAHTQKKTVADTVLTDLNFNHHQYCQFHHPHLFDIHIIQRYFIDDTPWRKEAVPRQCCHTQQAPIDIWEGAQNIAINMVAQRMRELHTDSPDEGSHGVPLVSKERPFIRTVLHNPVQRWSQYLGSSHSRVIHPLVLNVPVVKSRSIVRNEKLISIRVRARTLLGIFAPANIPDGKSFKTWINT